MAAPDARLAEAQTAALRQCLLVMMSDWSETNYAAGWMLGTEEMLHREGGKWEVLGRLIGWPTGHERARDFRWVAWDEAGRIFAERRSALAAAREETRSGGDAT
jgi:hypothetical protein